jgi:hypothetical protein
LPLLSKKVEVVPFFTGGWYQIRPSLKSSARQRRAIEAASKEIVPEEDALWENSASIKDWLKGLSAHKVM